MSVSGLFSVILISYFSEQGSNTIIKKYSSSYTHVSNITEMAAKWQIKRSLFLYKKACIRIANIFINNLYILIAQATKLDGSLTLVFLLHSLTTWCSVFAISSRHWKPCQLMPAWLQNNCRLSYALLVRQGAVHNLLLFVFILYYC